MGKLTIQEAKKYCGYSRQTLHKWLQDETLKGIQKIVAGRSTWLIDSSDVELLRQDRITFYKQAIENISTPVPGIDE